MHTLVVMSGAVSLSPNTRSPSRSWKQPRLAYSSSASPPPAGAGVVVGSVGTAGVGSAVSMSTGGSVVAVGATGMTGDGVGATGIAGAGVGSATGEGVGGVTGGSVFSSTGAGVSAGGASGLGVVGGVDPSGTVRETKRPRR